MNYELKSNPFPAFAVEPDFIDPDKFKQKSACTPSREELEKFLKGYYSGDYDNCVVGIRGDYGSGKTHLLRYAQMFFAEKNKTNLNSNIDKESNESIKLDQCLDNFCIYTTSTGTTFHEYFLRQIINQFDFVLLVDLLARFLAEVAIQEASKLSITKSAVDFLRNDYRSAKKLLQEDVLPTSRIMDNLSELITSYGNDEEISSVFVALIDPRFASAAYRWLTQGDKVSADDLDLLAIKSKLDNDEVALLTVKVIAHIFKAINVRWAVLVDQFEHLMQSERVKKTEHIQNTFKDFSVIMSQGHALIIAGHYSGWKAKEDFYGRFLNPIIDIRHLTNEDISTILSKYLNEEVGKDSAVVAALTEYCRGNFRTLLLLCNKLYKRLNVTLLKASETDVAASYEDIRYIRNQDVIIDNLSSQFRSIGVSFELGVMLAGIWQPTFIIPNRESPRVIIDVVSASKATDEIEKLRKLVNSAAIVRDKIAEPRILFILTGYVSSNILEEIKKVGFEAVDATDRSFDQRLTEFIEGVESTLNINTAIANTVSRSFDEEQMREVLARFDTIEQQRKKETAELEARLAELSKTTLNIHARAKSAEEPGNVEAKYQIGIESVLPEQFPRFKYVGGLTKIGFLFSSVYFLLILMTSYSQSLHRLLRPLIPFSAEEMLIVALTFFSTFAFFFYRDWNFVDMINDKLMNMRRRDLLIKTDIYIIHKREERVHWMLRRGSTLITSLKQRHIIRFIEDLEHEGEDYK